MITVIIPVYNTREYLKECIDSLLHQTYADFEIICVDDCSKDAYTLELLKKYEGLDARLQVIYLPENKGAAEARNIGLEHAKGEYVTFLDADDWFDADMLEKMHDSLVTSGADICVCGHRVYSEQSKAVVGEVSLRHVPGVTDRVFAVKELGEQGLIMWDCVPWNKMCSAEFLRKNHISFQNLTSSNDVSFDLMCCLLAKRIVYCEGGKPLLTYRTQSENQISANRTPLNHWHAVNRVLELSVGKMDEIESKQLLFVLIVGMISELGRSSNEGKRRAGYDALKSYLVKHGIKEPFKVRRYNTYINLWIENEYESKWFEKIADFDLQIEENAEIILSDVLSGHKRVVIWGNGKRGQALQRFCKKRGVKNLSVADQKNDLVGTYTTKGFLVIHTDDALEEADVIIASNYDIYVDLLKSVGDIKLIDLEKYCPIG